jgi:hypothetical protein
LNTVLFQSRWESIPPIFIPGISIPSIFTLELSVLAAPYLPIRICAIPNDSFAPTDMLQIRLEP